MLPFNNFKIYLNSKAGLTDDEILQLPYLPGSRAFGKAQPVLGKGQVCKDIFFVEKGLLRQYTIDEQGKEHIIHFAPEGWLVSDRSSAYFNQPGEYFIDTIEDSEVVIMDETFINAASGISKTYRENNHRALHNHVRHLQQRISQLLSASAEASPVNQLITSYVITPEYFANAIAYTVEKGVFTQAQAEQQFSVGNYILTGVIGGLITGLIFSAVVPVFLRSKRQVAAG